MANEQKELQQLFSVKEKNEQLLTNLDKLKASGSVTEDQYNSLKAGYIKAANEAGNIIETRKSNILQAIGTEEHKIAMLENEINTLSVRQQTGELTYDEVLKSQEKLQKQVQQKRFFIADMKRLHSSSRSADVGGYVDTKVTTAALAKTASRGVSSAGGAGIGAAIQGTSASDFTEIRTDINEIISSIPQLIGPFGALLLLIGSYLPWFKVLGIPISLQTVSQAASLSGAGSAFGLTSPILLIASLVGIVSIFLARENARGIIQFGFGGIALLSIVLPVLQVLYYVNSAMSSMNQMGYGYGSMMPSTSQLGSLFSIEIGLYLSIIATIIMIIGGIKELKN